MEWTWLRVGFDMGIPPGTEIPSEPREFIRWLTNPNFVKFLDDLTLRVEKLTTQPFD